MDIKEKDSGVFIVNGCIHWIAETQHNNPGDNNHPPKMLRECVLLDNTGNICLTVWQNHIEKLTENQWYQITDVTIKNYYGIKLSTSPKSIIEAITCEEQLNWDALNVQGYLEHELSAQKKQEAVLCCPDILTVSINKHVPHLFKR